MRSWLYDELDTDAFHRVSDAMRNMWMAADGLMSLSAHVVEDPRRLGDHESLRLEAVALLEVISRLHQGFDPKQACFLARESVEKVRSGEGVSRPAMRAVEQVQEMLSRVAAPPGPTTPWRAVGGAS